VAVYSEFVEGAKDGFRVAIGIVPYLVAMLVAVGVLRASGALDLALDGVRAGVGALGVDARWVDGLPTALMKPLSGSGARGMMIETMQTHGADSFAGRLASVIQGSTETTFYVLAVYFGSVGIRRTRHAVGCGLAADGAGILAAVLVTYLFFG
jgi:spore maturation protein SpmB